MKTSHLNERLQILASFGVLIGLIFLGLEIRQSNRIAVAATEISVREGYGSSNETAYTNPEVAALLAKARNADAEFSDVEIEMVDYFTGRLLNIWISSEKAYANEMVSEATLQLAIEAMKWTIDTYPSFRPFFEEWALAYPSSAGTQLANEMREYLRNK